MSLNNNVTNDKDIERIKEQMICDASSHYSDNISKIFKIIFGFEINTIKDFSPNKKELLMKYLDTNKEWLLINKFEEIKLKSEINLIEKANDISIKIKKETNDDNQNLYPL